MLTPTCSTAIVWLTTPLYSNKDLEVFGHTMFNTSCTPIDPFMYMYSSSYGITYSRDMIVHSDITCSGKTSI